MNQNHNKPVLDYIFEITITAYLWSFKYTSGLFNPNNEVENSTPVHQHIQCLLCAINVYWSKLTRWNKNHPWTLLMWSKELVCNKETSKIWRLLIRIRPENRPKGVKLRFEYDHIAPSGFGIADQEGIDSYVLFGSNTTYVWTGSPQMILKIV